MIDSPGELQCTALILTFSESISAASVNLIFLKSPGGAVWYSRKKHLDLNKLLLDANQPAYVRKAGVTRRFTELSDDPGIFREKYRLGLRI